MKPSDDDTSDTLKQNLKRFELDVDLRYGPGLSNRCWIIQIIFNSGM